jgi:hypothetical protein
LDDTPRATELQALMVMLNCCVACWPPLSATRSVKMNVPAVVGVPVLRPGDVVSQFRRKLARYEH